MSILRKKNGNNHNESDSLDIYKSQRNLTFLLSEYSNLIEQQISLEERIIYAINEFVPKSKDYMLFQSELKISFEDRQKMLEYFKTVVGTKLMPFQNSFDELVDKLSLTLNSHLKTIKKVNHYEQKLVKLVHNNKRKVTEGKKLSENKYNLMDRNEKKLESYKTQLCVDENMIISIQKKIVNEELKYLLPIISSFLQLIDKNNNYQDKLSNAILENSKNRDSAFILNSFVINT